MKHNLLLFLLLGGLILAASGKVVLAAQDHGDLLGAQLNQSYELILKMRQEGFQVQRLNDTFKVAQQIYSLQLQIAEKGEKPDYTLGFQYLETLQEISKKGYLARDEAIFVIDIYNKSKSQMPEADLSNAERLIKEMQFELESENYEEAYSLAKQAYTNIVEVEGQYSALKLAYKATSQTLKSFFLSYWKILAGGSLALGVLFFAFRKQLLVWKLKKKIKHMKEEAVVVEDLIRTSQTDYFNKGTMSESTYQIRIKKFSDLLRDLHRQIILFDEQMAKNMKLKEVPTRKR